MIKQTYDQKLVYEINTQLYYLTITDSLRLLIVIKRED